MLNSVFGTKNPELQKVTKQVTDRMLEVDVDSDEYKELFGSLEKLAVIQAADARLRVSPDTVAIVAANVLGILIIVGYEQAHVATSRALQFLLRTKIG
jgi:hypothetical protein